WLKQYLHHFAFRAFTALTLQTPAWVITSHKVNVSYFLWTTSGDFRNITMDHGCRVMQLEFVAESSDHDSCLIPNMTQVPELGLL
ncbi:unnamed protein product, partial [Brassica napus]